MDRFIKRINASRKDIDKYIIDNIKCLSNSSIYRNPDEMPKRIVAIGDIHGDLEALINILYDSDIIDTNGKWIARDTFLVQTGDIMDKYRNMELYQNVILKDGSTYNIQQNPITYKPEYGNPDDELVILGYLTDLHNQAIYGDFGNSRVILCFGNHEYLNTQLKKNLQYIDQYMNKSIYDFYGNPDLKERERILNPGKGDLIVKFACIFKVVVVIGDFMFMHGGLNNFNFSNIQKIEDIDKLNNRLMDYFLLGKPLPQEIVDGEYGILWNRELSNRKYIERTSCMKYFKILDRIGERHLNLVIGHTPQHTERTDLAIVNSPDLNGDTEQPYITRITKACGNRIFRIDTMMSRAFNLGTVDYRKVQLGKLNALEIILNPDGSPKNIFNIFHKGKTEIINEVNII
jgi:hypothetical protein